MTASGTWNLVIREEVIRSYPIQVFIVLCLGHMVSSAIAYFSPLGSTKDINNSLQYFGSPLNNFNQQLKRGLFKPAVCMNICVGVFVRVSMAFERRIANPFSEDSSCSRSMYVLLELPTM